MIRRRPRRGPLLGTRTIAQRCHCGENTVRRWIDRGLLPGTRLASGHRRVEESVLTAFLQRHGMMD